MEERFNLSEKEQEILLSKDIYFKGYPSKDVKEFIKLIKKSLKDGMLINGETIKAIIDERAREKFTEVVKNKQEIEIKCLCGLKQGCEICKPELSQEGTVQKDAVALPDNSQTGCGKYETRGAYTFTCGKSSKAGKIQLCSECNAKVNNRGKDE